MMPIEAPQRPLTSARSIEDHVRRSTHGRIRDLMVEEDRDRVVVRGSAPSHHMRQLALHAALQIVAGRLVQPCITVG